MSSYLDNECVKDGAKDISVQDRGEEEELTPIKWNWFDRREKERAGVDRVCRPMAAVTATESDR